MKRVVGISTLVLAAVGLVAYLSGGVLAQGQPAGVGGGKVATVNLYVIMKNYKKWSDYKKEIDQLQEPFVKQLEKLTKDHDGWIDYAKKNAATMTEAKKTEAQNAITTYKRQIEDKQKEAQKVIAKRMQEQVVQIYKDIETGIQKYAAANGIAVVFHYLEPAGQSQEEISMKYTPGNIERKMQGTGSSGGCFPVYTAPGVDISESVVNVLNSSYTGPATATSGKQ